jgi:hypothetical protein
MNGDALLIVLSTGTYHLITGLKTSPILAPTLSSLELSIGAREASLDCIHEDVYIKDRFRTVPKEEKEVTIHMSGWTATGDYGEVFSWVHEWVENDSAGNQLIFSLDRSHFITLIAPRSQADIYIS